MVLERKSGMTSMNYLAHTAEDDGGRRLADESRWQLLKDRLRFICPSMPPCRLKTAPQEVTYGR
jgi:hypothetical protein